MLAIALLLAAAEPMVDVDATDRALAGGAAALGAVAGAVLGSSTALGMGAYLAGTNSAARTVPELTLPPAFAAIGAGAAGAAAGGSGWAGGVGALAGAGVATLGLALGMPAAPDEGSQRRNARFAALVLVPALAAALVSGGAAALFVEPAPPSTRLDPSPHSE